MAKAAKPFRPVAATANDLRSGAVVYRGRDGAWTGDLSLAEIAETEVAAGDLLARAKADHDANIVVEPVLIEMKGGKPATLKERIRGTGPTVAPPV